MSYVQLVTGVNAQGSLPTPRVPYQPYAGGYNLTPPSIQFQQYNAAIKAALDGDYQTGQSGETHEVLVRTPVTFTRWVDNLEQHLRAGSWLAIQRSADPGRNVILAAVTIRDFNIIMKKDYNLMMGYLEAGKAVDPLMLEALRAWNEQGEDAFTRDPRFARSLETAVSWTAMRSLSLKHILRNWNLVSAMLVSIRDQVNTMQLDGNVGVQGPPSFSPCDNLWGRVTEGHHVGVMLTRRRDAMGNYHEFRLEPWFNDYPFPPDSMPDVYYDNAGIQHHAHRIYYGTVYQQPLRFPSPRQIPILTGELGEDADNAAMDTAKVVIVLGEPTYYKRVFN